MYGGKDLGRRELVCVGVVIEKNNIFWLIISLCFIEVNFLLFFGGGLFCSALIYYLSTKILHGEKCIF